jgi:SAM-dependent methyltransferase
MPLEHVPCPFCRGEEHRPWDDENGFYGVKCTTCGLVYVNPRPGPSDRVAATELGLHPTDRSDLDVVGGFRPARVGKFARRLRTMFPDALPGREVRWLDVGAGFGELLLGLNDLVAAGSELTGLEPCRPKREHARGLGLDVQDASWTDMNGPYEFISLINVLSHLADPLDALAELRALLAPEGRILLVTGNGGDISPAEYPGRYDFPDHLLFAGRENLRAAVEGAGFRVDAVHEFRTTLPRPAVEEWAERALAAALRRRVGHSGAFRSMWVVASRVD